MNEQIEAALRGKTFYEGGLPRTQRGVIRDVMLAAGRSDTWLTLTEVSRLTSFTEPSVSAQLRHLKADGFLLTKRRRWQGETHFLTWEYRLEFLPRSATSAASR